MHSNFVAPVFKGWVVNFKASVNYVSKTSMEVGVRVDAENPMLGKTIHGLGLFDLCGLKGSMAKLVLGSTLENRNAGSGSSLQAAEKRRELRSQHRLANP